VENTYISIFQVLGGLAVILGSAGLGLVTARNLMERRDEFAILQAVGVPCGIIRHIALLETGQFIRWGLGIGGLAAMVSILPALAGDGTGKPLMWSALLVLLIAANAWLWSWLVIRCQIRELSPCTKLIHRVERGWFPCCRGKADCRPASRPASRRNR